MTHSDSKHYEFYVTFAKVGEIAAPPPGEGWVLLHVAASAPGGVFVMWSRSKQKKH